MGFVAKLAVAAGVLAFLASLVDWRSALVLAARADLAWVAVALAVTMLGVVVSAEKWRGLLDRAAVRLSLGRASRLYWIGMFFSNFLPTSVGGDAARLVLTPAPGRMVEVASSIFVERLTGLAILVTISALGLLLGPALFPMRPLPPALLVLVLALAAATGALVTLPNPLRRALALLAPRLPRWLRRPVAILARLAAAVARQTRDHRAVGRALLLSLPFYLTVLLAQWATLRAVGADITLAEVLVLGTVVQLVAALPISLNGLGVAEAAFVGLYTAVGVPPHVALAAALVRRLVDLANSALGGLLWLGYRRDGHRVDRPVLPAQHRA